MRSPTKQDLVAFLAAQGAVFDVPGRQTARPRWSELPHQVGWSGTAFFRLQPPAEQAASVLQAAPACLPHEADIAAMQERHRAQVAASLEAATWRETEKQERLAAAARRRSAALDFLPQK